MSQHPRSEPSASAPQDRATTFPERLAQLIGDGSIRGFARRAGVSDTFVRQCLAGRTDPTRAKLLQLATAGGVSVEWLATGQSVPAPDPGMLEAVVAAVEQALAEQDDDLAPVEKARLVRAACEQHCQHDAQPPSVDRVRELIASTRSRSTAAGISTPVT